ncbi:hypothetical protein ET266_01770 [Escherichia coli]|uniref:PIN domain-containing protein n=3 Tax=Escherichia coli TaxID=562 RepID=UPI000B7D33F7|nr:PIN domain-containing protein [Escherichia coli]EEY5242699.1 hypothetical protein [Escherichia coli]EEY5249530.1 hypothetical protein [Escherichia coli]EFA4490924.1 hypothetical protein [Escherichia coli]EFA4546563.1 hypothetical protein [Escherichia coli]EFB2647158.1 hypothetical protein [Escherichia coli]
MKSTFLGFYSTPTESLADIWLDDSTLFVFDTNCLLNLYRCEDHTREDIIKVMKAVAPRTWIPFQVGFEFQRNRRVVIEDSIASLDKIHDELKKIYTQNILSSGSVKKQLYNALSEEISSLQEQIKKPIDDYINEKIVPRISSKKKISEHDFIRDQIDEIILDKVGEPPTQEKINKINELGEKRYENKLPPGFKDASKQDKSFFSNIEFQDKYGDLYLWKEIIEKAKSEDIKSVIFICDDNKSDWWFIHSGKTHGALASLKTEICTEANIDNFKLINQLTFLHEAKSYLNDINISESSLKEVEELSSLKAIKKLDEVFSSYLNNYHHIDNKDNMNNKNNITNEPESFENIEYINHDFHLFTSVEENVMSSQNAINRAHNILRTISHNEDELSAIIGFDTLERYKLNLSRRIQSTSNRLYEVDMLLNKVDYKNINYNSTIMHKHLLDNNKHLTALRNRLQDAINEGEYFLGLI